MRRFNFTLGLLLFLFLFSSCTKEKTIAPSKKEGYTTEIVVILVIDGPRYSETWGDPGHENIPVLSKTLSKRGIVSTEFYNLGPTYTSAGHTAITTGHYQELNNGGSQLPKYPSIFQHWMKKANSNSKVSYVIASKDKLEVLSDTKLPAWQGSYRPKTDCGVSGVFSGYRSDEVTFKNTLEILSKEKPKLVLINLKDPDFYAHKNQWENYIEGIKKSDEYMGRIWNFLEEHPFYRGRTTFFVTNDHGRHFDDVENGFIQHGDACGGCRHINFFASGPDFKQNLVLDTPRSQIDISKTVGELLGFDMPFSDGVIMQELFK